MVIKKSLAALSLLTLTACSVGSYSYSRDALERVDMNFVGIPTVLGVGAIGSSIPLTEEYSLTAAHVARWTLRRVKAYHPYCDLAVIYHKNDLKTLPVFRVTRVGESVNMYGYSFFTAMPVKSSGTNLALTGIHNGWNKKPCVAMASNAGAVQGMSGGAVYHRDGTLGGVIVGYASEVKKTATQAVRFKDVSLFIPYQVFRTWLDESTS